MAVRDLETVYEISKLEQVPIHWWIFVAILFKKGFVNVQVHLGSKVFVKMWIMTSPNRHIGRQRTYQLRYNVNGV
jgi:hypothetical protein